MTALANRLTYHLAIAWYGLWMGAAENVEILSKKDKGHNILPFPALLARSENQKKMK